MGRFRRALRKTAGRAACGAAFAQIIECRTRLRGMGTAVGRLTQKAQMIPIQQDERRERVEDDTGHIEMNF